MSVDRKAALRRLAVLAAVLLGLVAYLLWTDERTPAAPHGRAVWVLSDAALTVAMFLGSWFLVGREADEGK